ncbi:MAG TPA: alpha/beta fold hydrolase [Pyrinomonadaceae bacterium]|nr:alpha/beta fold hydrolase [Pyrinomonadaceae bacterium]
MKVLLLLLPFWLYFSSAVFATTPFQITSATSLKRKLNDKLTKCRLPGLDEEVLCGRFEVYEDRAARKGRKISLHIVVLPAKTDKVAPDPLVYLAGGGVLPATEYVAFFARAFPHLRQHRDILLVDQRGTGESNRLDCDLPSPIKDRLTLFDEVRYLEAIRRCRKELESKADLRFYTTPIAMDDLDEVRQWLGYSRLNLYGMSYGTKAALVYMRQHPKRVRAAALHGAIPLDVSIWSDTAPLAQQALERVFDACAKQEQCRVAFPNLRQEFDSLLKRLSGNPVTVKVESPNGGLQMELTIDDRSVRNFVYGALFSINAIREIPLMIHLAFQEDYRVLAQRLIPRGRGVPRGIFLSLVCSEGVQQIKPDDVREAANTFFRDFSIRRQLQICKEWTKAWLPKDFWKPVTSNAPVLILSSELDHTTPPRYGDTAVRTLTSGRHLVLPSRSHNDVDPCVTGLIEAFVVSGSVEKLDTSCAANQHSLTFVTSPDALRKP